MCSDMIAVASSYIAYANTMLVLCGIFVAAASVAAVVFYNRDKRRIIEETKQNILIKIADDEQMREEFICKILENEKFLQEFKAMFDIYISDKLAMIDNEKQEKSSLGGLK